MLQTEPDRPKAHERIRLFRKKVRLALHRFVPTEVQRADHDRVWRHALGHRFVGNKLLLLRGNPRRVEEQILGAIQADALREIVLHQRNFVHLLDVRLQGDRHAVQRHRRPAICLEQTLLKGLLFRLDLSVAEQRLLRWVYDHKSVVAIHEHPIPGLHPLREIADAHHRRNFHGPGDDHRVARLAARVRHDP